MIQGTKKFGSKFDLLSSRVKNEKSFFIASSSLQLRRAIGAGRMDPPIED